MNISQNNHFPTLMDSTSSVIPKSKEAIEVAAKLTARYSDAAGAKEEVLAEYKPFHGAELHGDQEQRKERIVVSPLDENEVARLRI